MPASSSPAPHHERSVHFPVSPFFLVGIVAAITSSIAVGVATVLANAPVGPPPGSDRPPPPPQTSMIVLDICMGLFVISWIMVAAAIARDQILRRMQTAGEHRNGTIDELRAQVEGLRDELDRNRRADRALIEEHLAQYGEQRETEGYLNAMRDTAAGKGEVRALRPLPPRTKD